MSIAWPPEFDPATAPVHVVNRLSMTVPASLVWQRLIDARHWPLFYDNAANILIEGGGDRLGPGTVFRWRSFGVHLLTTVREFEPETRLAWLATSTGIRAWHAWEITPTETGCDVLTEETQHGLVARLGKLVYPARMHEQHQRWLEGLARPA